MPSHIEDYALIGDRHSAGLVARDGSIDWLCLPRFDSGACFAALLGTNDNGRWSIAPVAPVRAVRRRYRPGTLVLETELETDEGAVSLIDFMPPRAEQPSVVRIVVGRRGRVALRTECVLRFDYGCVVPWVTRLDHGRGIRAIAGPDTVVLHGETPLHGEGLRTVGELVVGVGDRRAFVLTWHPSHLPASPLVDAEQALTSTEAHWRAWGSRLRQHGEWHDAVQRSLITLRALTYEPTGGIVAAVTTSLPEQWRGPRNWDYRYCWLRDATFTLDALMSAGYAAEARAWREWLLRTVAGSPSQLQIMYGLAGERRLTEIELDWLPGYEGARPVRIGNAAHRQLQLDVYGEVMDSIDLSEAMGLAPGGELWSLQRLLMERLETLWREPDEGLWEVRGGRQHFTHSKVMAWVAMDRAVRSVERLGLEGPVSRWRAVRDAIHEEVCRRGFHRERGAFTQVYGSTALDASLLMLPLVGFLPASDPRMRATLDAIRRELTVDGLVLRYAEGAADDGLPPGEGTFLLCTFWLADNLALRGEAAEARAIFERLLALRNDVGLLSEQYDPRARRMLGNFPQAFSHVALVNCAHYLARGTTPGMRERRAE